MWSIITPHLNAFPDTSSFSQLKFSVNTTTLGWWSISMPRRKRMKMDVVGVRCLLRPHATTLFSLAVGLKGLHTI